MNNLTLKLIGNGNCKVQYDFYYNTFGIDYISNMAGDETLKSKIIEEINNFSNNMERVQLLYNFFFLSEIDGDNDTLELYNKNMEFTECSEKCKEIYNLMKLFFELN